MIYLTFVHSRELFTGANFKPWVKRLFPSVKFEGCKTANYEPTISVSLIDFERAKECIPTKNLIRIKGVFNVIEHLVLGVRDFDNQLKYKR